jgi:hypothetical protein
MGRQAVCPASTIWKEESERGFTRFHETVHEADDEDIRIRDLLKLSSSDNSGNANFANETAGYL